MQPNELPDSVQAVASNTSDTLIAMNGAPIEARSLLFDPDWYRTEYPDVGIAGIDPIRHFFDDGAREGRNPNPFFATFWYIGNNADVAAAKINPFLHYVFYGAREGRRPRPDATD